MTEPGTPKRTRMPRAERREHLMDVATEMIRDHGVDRVTMEGVAAAAGVSKGLGYAYFEDRGDLLLALLNRELAALEQRSTEAMAAATSFEGRVRAAVTAWFDVVEERGILLGALLQANQISRVDRRRSRYYRSLEEAWGQMAADELGVDRDRAVAAAAVVLAGLSGILERRAHGDPRALLEETYVTLVMRGVEGLRRNN